MRIGIFGGSFDPIHQGHVILAENCRDQAKLDQVLFIPCATNPLKTEGPTSTDRQRCEMVELAIAGHESFRLSKIEIERKGVSFTADTLESLAESHPNDELFLLMGDDSLESFDRWQSPERICEIATPLVANRPGSGAVDLSVLEKYCSAERYQQACEAAVESPMIEISSSGIRDRIKSKNSIRYLLPRGVQRYIESQSVYLPKPSS